MNEKRDRLRFSFFKTKKLFRRIKMENKQNTNGTNGTKLEILEAQLALVESEQKGLASQKKSLKREIAELKKAAEEVVEAPETPVVEEVSEEEAPETPVVEEVSEEEAPETPVVEEVSEEEAPETPVVEEVSEEEAPETPVVEEVSEEETDGEEPNEVVPVEQQKPAKEKKDNGTMPLLIVAIIAALALLAVVIASMFVGGNNNAAEVPPANSDSQVETPVDSGTSEDVLPEDVVSGDFKNGVVNIAKTLTDDEVTANVDILVENIGEDKLAELVEKYGELPVQKAIAEYLAFVPEIKMNQYISNNGLSYNPNAADDYSQYLDEADLAYSEATGKNPNGALMSLEGYDIHKSNRDAMKDLIIKSGDLDLLTWYEAKTEGYDLMLKQEVDTESALAYKETVKTEILTSQGTVDLLEIQLEQETNGTLTVTDNNTMQYTDSYDKFVIDNYIYVVANQ